MEQFPDHELKKIRSLLRRILAFLIVLVFLTFGILGVLFCQLLNTLKSNTQSVTPASSVSAPAADVSEDAADKEADTDDFDATGDSSHQQEGDPAASSVAKDTDLKDKETWIKEKISSMTAEEKIAQLFILSPQQLTGTDHPTKAGSKTQEAFSQYPVGGLIYFEENLIDPEQTRSLLEDTQKISMEQNGIPCLLALDEEGGSVTRIAKNPNFSITNSPNISEIGSKGEPKDAYKLGKTIGTYLKELGFNLDFAPVADIISNAENTVVKQRSFGSAPELVSKMVASEVSGLKEAGICSTLKHWPGHGNTSGDTHKGFTDSDADWATLRKREYLPFQAGIEAGADFVMVGHFSDYAVTGSYEPASLSYKLIQPLREELGFEGVILTDALNMGAISDYAANSGEAAIAAFKAGSDMLLYPADFKLAYRYMLDSLKSDKSASISEERVDESLYRILSVKYDLLSEK